MNRRVQKFLLGWYLPIGFLVFFIGCNTPKRLSSIFPDPTLNNITKIERTYSLPNLGSGTYPIQIQYLGCGGLFIHVDSTAILLDPFFSNPCLSDVILGTLPFRTIHSDSNKIKEGLAKIEKYIPGGLQKTKAIFVSHSHYDHLMDVPVIFREIKDSPMVYLNQSGANTCALVIPEKHRSILDSPGIPVEIPTRGGAFTITPIAAAHNPHAFCFKFFANSRKKPLGYFTSPYQKTRPWAWREGKTFSFLIDLKDSAGIIQFRIYVQSNSCDPIAENMPPNELLTGRPVDLAFMGVASYHFSKGYPDNLIRHLQPKNVAWIHWEDFFGQRGGEPRTVRQTNVKKFLQTPRPHFPPQFLPFPGANFIMD